MEKIKKMVIMSFVVGIGIFSHKMFMSSSEDREIENNELVSENVMALSDAVGGIFEYPTGKPNPYKCGVPTSKNKSCGSIVDPCQGGGQGCNSLKCSLHAH